MGRPRRSTYLARSIALCALLCLVLMLATPVISTAALTSAQVDALISGAITNAQVVAQLEGNSAFVSYVGSSATAQAYFTNDQAGINAVFTTSYMTSQVDGSPTLAVELISNPSFSSIAASPSQFTTFFSASQLQSIINNPALQSSLLSNPSLGTVVTYTSGFESLITSPGFSSISSSTTTLNDLLANPALYQLVGTNVMSTFLSSSYASSILDNPTALQNLVSNPSISTIVADPTFQQLLQSSGVSTLLGSSSFVSFIASPAFTTFLSNPSISTVIANPANLVTLLDNPTVLNEIGGNSLALGNLMSNPALGTIMTNPQSFLTLVGTTAFTQIAGNSSELTALLGNPALSSVISNPTAFNNFFTNPTAAIKADVLDNPAVLSGILGSSTFSSIIGNSTGLDSILTASQLSSIVSNPTALLGLLNNPSIPSILGSPSTLTSFLGNSEFSSIISDTPALSSLLSNPSLSSVLTNPSALSSILTGSGSSLLTGAALNSLLNNPSLGSLLGTDPTLLNSLLSSSSLSSILNNPSTLSSLLANPSLSSLVGQTGSLSSLLSNPSFSNLLSSSNAGALSSLLANPSLTNILSNPSSLTNFLSNPSFSNLLGNSQLLNSIMGNSGLSSILGSSSQLGALSSLLGNSGSLSNLLNNPNALSSLLSNPSLSSILGNPTSLSNLQSLIQSPVLSSLFGNGNAGQALTALLSNPQLSNILSSNSATTSLLNALGSSSSLSGLTNALSGVLGNGILGAISGLGNLGNLGSLLGSYGQCIDITDAGTACFYVNSTTVTTNYSNSQVGGGSIIQGGTTGTITTPVINNVTYNNTENSSYLITCPAPPNPYNTSQYISTANYTAGNRCLLNSNPLKTTVSLQTTVTPQDMPFFSTYFYYYTEPPESISQQFSIHNLAQGDVQDIGYDAEAQNQGTSAYNLSNAYDTSSYIFQGIASKPQYGLWTWSAKYANLQKTNLNDLNLTKEEDDLTSYYLGIALGYITVGYVVIPIPVVMLCDISYDYKFHSYVTALNNTNLTVPITNQTALGITTGQGNQWSYGTPQNYAQIGGYVYSPITETTDSQGGCFASGNPTCGQFILISVNASAYYNGQSYNDLPAYVQALNLVGQSSQANIELAQQITYFVVIPQSDGSADILHVNLPNDVDFKNFSVFPYFVYGATVPSAYSSFTGQSFLNLSDNLYSPNDYVGIQQPNPGADETNFVSPFPVYSGTGFLARYVQTDQNTKEPNFNSQTLFEYPTAASLAAGGTANSQYANSGAAISYFPFQLSAIPTNPIGGLQAAPSGSILNAVGFTNIPSPTAIAESPNGYIYVLTSAPSPEITGSSGSGYLYILKYIPTGYFNFSVDQPSGLVPWPNKAQWVANSKAYFGQYMLADTPGLYIVEYSVGPLTNLIPNFQAVNLATDASGDLFLEGYNSEAPGQNLIIAEITAGGTANYGTFPYPYTVGTGSAVPTGAPIYQGDFAASPGGQFVYVANPSDGGYVYIYSTNGGSSSGNGNTGSWGYAGDIPLEYTGPSGPIDIAKYLSHGGPDVTVSQGGAPGSPISSQYQEAVGSTQPSCSTGSSPTCAVASPTLDSDTYHDPFALADSDGVLYVMDNWTFQVSGVSGTSSVWELRAFSDNNIEIPIDGYQYNTWQTQPTAGSVAGFGSFTTALSPTIPPYGWAPYGWPLAANISVPFGVHNVGIEECRAWGLYCYQVSQATGQNTFSLCSLVLTGSYGCNGYYTGTFPTVGPYITSYGLTGGGQSFGGHIQLAEDGTGTVYLAVYDTGGPTQQSGGSNFATAPYLQLLIFNPQIQNYTSTKLGQGIPYNCFASNKAVISPSPAGTCIYSPALTSLLPPIIGVPDATLYNTGLGSPVQYYTAQGSISSLLPTGQGNAAQQANYTTGANTAFNNGYTAPSGSTTIDYSQLDNAPETLVSAPPSSLGRSYISSAVNGYVVTPYDDVRGTHQEWSDVETESDTQISIGTVVGPDCPVSIPSADKTTSEYAQQSTNLQQGGQSLLSSLTGGLFGSSTGIVNYTIEGGNTYLEFGNTNATYQANLSDGGLITTPYLFYNVFADRLFGEIYINQTIGPQSSPFLASFTKVPYDQMLMTLPNLTASGSTLPQAAAHSAAQDVFVINATHNYNYQQQYFVQTAPNFGSAKYPAYAVEVSDNVSTNPNATILGANCGGNCLSGGSGLLSTITGLLNGGAQNYYYNTSNTSRFYQGPSAFNYTFQSETQYFQLFSLYKRASYLYHLTLQLNDTSGSGGILSPLLNLFSSPGGGLLGYNRLMYTYVDRFNNTIYTPLAVDFANETSIFMTTNSVVSSSNPNQSTININGTLDVVTPFGVRPLAGAPIYLYYDTDLGYYNASQTEFASNYNGNMDQAYLAYYKYAETCALAPSSNFCQLANPLSTAALTPQQIQILANESKQVTYQPNFVNGACPQPPNQLLQLLQQFNCNINGPVGTANGNQASPVVYGDGSTANLSADWGSLTDQTLQFCEPQLFDGSGQLTHQIGLINIVQTNANGNFSQSIYACGVGSHNIIAKYYGNPAPEPIYIYQTAIPHSTIPFSQNASNDSVDTQVTSQGTTINGAVNEWDSSELAGITAGTPEWNYSYQPNTTTSSVQIGTYSINLGNIYALAPLIIIVVLIFAAKATTGQGGSVFDLFGFAAMYDVVNGITGGQQKGLRSGYKPARIKKAEPHQHSGKEKREVIAYLKQTQAEDKKNNVAPRTFVILGQNYTAQQLIDQIGLKKQRLGREFKGETVEGVVTRKGREGTKTWSFNPIASPAATIFMDMYFAEHDIHQRIFYDPKHPDAEPDYNAKDRGYVLGKYTYNRADDPTKQHGRWFATGYEHNSSSQPPPPVPPGGASPLSPGSGMTALAVSNPSARRGQSRTTGGKPRGGPGSAPQGGGIDPYTVLGLSAGASDADVQQRYRELAKKYHPDAVQGKSPIEQAEALRKFKEATEAKNKILGDRAKFGDYKDLDTLRNASDEQKLSMLQSPRYVNLAGINEQSDLALPSLVLGTGALSVTEWLGATYAKSNMPTGAKQNMSQEEYNERLKNAKFDTYRSLADGTSVSNTIASQGPHTQHTASPVPQLTDKQLQYVLNANTGTTYAHAVAKEGSQSDLENMMNRGDPITELKDKNGVSVKDLISTRYDVQGSATGQKLTPKKKKES